MIRLLLQLASIPIFAKYYQARSRGRSDIGVKEINMAGGNTNILGIQLCQTMENITLPSVCCC